MWEHLIAAVPAGWARRAPGVLSGITGSTLPTLNGVWIYNEDGVRAAVPELLTRVAATGHPHCLQLCPGSSNALHDVARERGMRRDTDVPLMALVDPGALPEAGPPELVITTLTPERVSVHAELAAAGFGAPVDDLNRLMTPVAAASGVCIYVGQVAGEPVVTGAGVQLGDQIGVFNIATLPAHRQRGYGAAITAQIVRDGLSRGARWAWLQSSAEGHGVYEKLGFITLEVWECWIDPGLRDVAGLDACLAHGDKSRFWGDAM